MKNTLIFFIFFTTFLQTLTADPQSSTENAFTRGYLSSKLEDKFENEKIKIDIQDQKIIVYFYPDNFDVCNEVKSYLEAITDHEVIFDSSYQPAQEMDAEPTLTGETEEGDFLPELSPFFPTMLAEPHIIGYSAGYRSYDKIFRLSTLPVSLGDQFSLYQIKTDSSGRIYIGIEACVWAIFEARAKSLSLINADYYVALPITYINKKFSMRLRFYHESSHLGDEFLLEHPNLYRLNPSMEAVDLSLSYDITDRLTAFIGYSRVLRSDESYKIKPNKIYYGFNYFLDFCKIKIGNLEGIPYLATYFANHEDNKWQFDNSVAIGYQWDKLYGHKLRVYVEGHQGFSPDGQFSKRKTKYIAVKLLYGY